MIVLDTNVISEPLKPAPAANVLEWLDRQTPESLYITTISLAELLMGVEQLPTGKRKRALADDLAETLDQLFEDRFLSFDREAAAAYALLARRAALRGISISFGDGQIAAIAAVHGYTVATRDVQPFLATGLTVINPWEV